MWAKIVTILLGLWLMVSPTIFDVDKTISNNAYVAGPLIISFAIIALSEATHSVRLYNIPVGLWLLLAPWVLEYNSTTATINQMTVGILVVILPFVKANIKETFGGGWTGIWKKDALHVKEANRMPRA